MLTLDQLIAIMLVAVNFVLTITTSKTVGVKYPDDVSATNELVQTIKPLLRIAPSKVRLMVKQSTQEVLVIYDKWVWMVVHQQYRFPPAVDVMVRVWNDYNAQAPSDTHYFDTLWSLRVWIDQRFQALKS